MLDVTVKTLDGKNRSFSVPDDITVKEFKDKIATSIEISAENQRLIFIGRVLQDEKKLNDYDVNGKTVHVVERPPPSARTNGSGSTGAAGGATNTTGRNPPHNFVLGSIRMPGHPGNVQNLVQQAFSGIGGIGGNTIVSTRSSADGGTVDLRINMGHVQVPQSEAQRRIDIARRMIQRANTIVNRIENPLLTEGNERDGQRNTAPHSDLPHDVTEADLHDVEAISIVTETVEAEIEMETDEDSGVSNVTAIHIPPGSQTSVESIEIGPETSTAQTTTSQTSQTSTPQTPSPVRPSTYAELLGELFTLNTRLQPFLERYHIMLAEDKNYTGQTEVQNQQHFFDNMSEVLHYLSHAYHNISDLMIDMNQASPRQLRAVATPLSHVPIHGSINIQNVPDTGSRVSRANVQPTSTGSRASRANVQPTSTGVRATSASPRSSTTTTPSPRTQSGTPVVSSNSSTTTTSTPTRGIGRGVRFPAPEGANPFLPPGVLENIIRMASNAAASAVQQQMTGPVHGQHRVIVVTQTGNNSTSPSSGGITSTAGGQRPAAPPPMPIPMSGVHTIDPNLRCHSRHFLPQRVAGLVRSSNNNATSRASDPVQTSQHPYINQLRNLLRQGNSTGDSSGQVTDDMFTQLVTGIGQYLGQASSGQEPRGSINDFLSTLGDSYVTPTGQSVLSDIFNTVANSINLFDLMQIFSGVTNSLQRTRVPLQEYIRDSLLQGQEATSSNVESSVNRVLNDAHSVIEQLCAGVQPRDDIDLEATVNTLLENHLVDLVTFILNCTENEPDFHTGLYTRVRRLIDEGIILGELCLPGGFSQLTDIIRDRVTGLASDVNPMIRQWMSGVTVQQVQALRPSITVRSQDVNHYVIRRPQGETDTQSHSSDETFMSADEDTPESGTRPRGSHDHIIPREAPQGGAIPKRLTQGAKLYTENGELADVGSEHTTSTLRPQMTPMAYQTVRCSSAPENNPPVPDIMQQQWHSVVPQEWVPVISRDVETQRSQSRQKPFSDAYIAGNPAKKRKLHSHTEELFAPHQSIAESIGIAADTVRAQPMRNVDTLASEIRENSQLQRAFHEEVRNEVRNNLRSDRDLVPHKYQNTEKYFGNKK